MTSAAPKPAEVLASPASARFIALSFFAAFLLNLLPWQGAILWLRPDLVALLLLYWCTYQPRQVGMAAAWSMGLLMDVADGNLLGQHALAYVGIAYIALKFHRRILRFTPWRQALHIALLLLLGQGLMLLVRSAAGSGFVSWVYFLSGFSGALLWPGLLLLLQWLQRSKPKTKDVYSA